MLHGSPLLAAMLLSAATASAQESAPHQAVDFTLDVQPIFAARCYECHGDDKQRAGLRLDSRAAALAGSDNGEVAVIAVGDADASLLYQLVTSLDVEERMPPKGDALGASQIDILRRWIDEGATGPANDGARSTHWAYVAPQRPPLPEPAHAEWARNEIDLFVLRELEAAGLAPSPEADRATLARRLSFDLTGLPPSPAELDAFLADGAPDAYERLVERLLASPHYGERMARGWLDLARYADTNGYEKDERRTMWRYRDWVIAAFNADMGYDEFTIEQIAGDLLPEPTLDQLIATGFHRNTMVNAEGGVDQEEYRVAAVIDRVNTTATVWLATTMNCVQCHTHKFDPFSQREYYRLFAYFNSTADIGPSVQPEVAAPTEEFVVAEARAAQEQAALEQKLATWTPELATGLAEFERRYASRETVWQDITPRWPNSLQGATLTVEDDGSVLASGAAPKTDTYELQFDVPEAGLRSFTIDVLRHASLEKGGPARAAHGNFVLSEVSLWLVRDEADSEIERVPLRSARADFFQAGPPPWRAEDAIDGNPQTGWAIGGAVRQDHRLQIDLEQSLEFVEGATLLLRMEQLYQNDHLIGCFRVRVTESESAALEAVLAPGIEALLTHDIEAPSTHEAVCVDDSDYMLHAWFAANSPVLDDDRARLAELKARAGPPTALVMRELEAPRATHVLTRGSFLSPGEEVQAGVPAVLNSMPEDAPNNRLGLAQWLVAPDNPLTARVAVNRLWEQVFSRGLVATSLDFGTQGARPTHPELLDWMALQLQADDWSLKQCLRRIVTSATYRQSSDVSEELRARDPNNLLFARSPRYRVEAEMVRDLALHVSGLLADKLGGPSVMPPQPEGVWTMTYNGDRWMAATNEDRFRRGLYTFWRRTAPYPTFATFDAPSRELVCVRRPDSNTPLQALALLNDPAFVEASIALAARVLRTRDCDADGEKIAFGFRLCTSREPTQAELAVLAELLTQERANYQAEPSAAEALLATDVDLHVQDLPKSELAAWTIVSNVLLNLDETITRN